MKPNVEDKIIRSSFQPRDYQAPIRDVIFNQGGRRLVIVLPRRAGKDLTLWNCAIDQCLAKTCLVMYAGVNYGAVRKTIWDAIDIDGKKFLEYIPERLIAKINQAEMKITFINGSILMCVGADSHKTSFRGGNPFGIILSEFAYYEDPTVLDTVMPIVVANGGWVALASTPQGKNTFHSVYKMAQELPDWWVYLKTVHDTNHIPYEGLEAEKKRMSPELFAQEYLCSFDRGIDGAIFGKALNSLRLNGHITSVQWEPGLLVHTAWDLGLSKGNETTIIFFQIVGDGTVIRIIDCYSSNNLGLDVYVAKLQEKPYKYGIHLGPHDLMVREWGAGAVTRYEKARNLDITYTVLPQTLLSDQVENALTHFPKVWIDAVKCKSLIDALENYYREWDEQRQVYKPKPVHNWASNYASAFMGMFLGLHHCMTNKGADEYDKIRNEALYGKFSNLPRVFQKGLKEQGF